MCVLYLHHGKDNDIYDMWMREKRTAKTRPKIPKACHPLVQNLPSKAKVVIRRKNSPIEAWQSSHGARWVPRSVFTFFF